MVSPRLTIAAVLIAGITAGVAVSPVFFASTFVVVALIAAGLRGQSVGPPATSEWSAFSGDLRVLVEDALHQATGDAHHALLDIAVCARSMLGSVSSTLDASHERTTRTNVQRLVEACCRTAVELPRIDEALVGAGAPQDAGSRERLTEARGLLAKRLKDAGDALRELYGAGFSGGTPASQRVAELTSELTDDAASRRAAIAELSALLTAVQSASQAQSQSAS